MKQLLIALCCLSFFTTIYAQKKKAEFEGFIKYDHKITAKDSSYNVEYDYAALGRHSEFYYKSGNTKFANQDAYFKADLFRSKDYMDYLLFNNSDTVLCLDARKSDVEVLEFDVKESADTILNYSCNLLTIKLKPVDRDAPISYRRYYYSKKLAVNPDHFKGCKGNCYDLIYAQMQAVPLKIEFEWPNKIVTWQASEIVQQPLKDEVFEVDKKAVLQKIN